MLDVKEEGEKAYADEAAIRESAAVNFMVVEEQRWVVGSSEKSFKEKIMDEKLGSKGKDPVEDFAFSAFNLTRIWMAAKKQAVCSLGCSSLVRIKRG